MRNSSAAQLRVLWYSCTAAPPVFLGPELGSRHTMRMASSQFVNSGFTVPSYWVGTLCIYCGVHGGAVGRPALDVPPPSLA
jgi:hypothetical protein